MPYFMEYHASKTIELAAHNNPYGANPFYSVIMAAMRLADTDNLNLLKDAFPGVYDNLQARYNAAGGALTVEESWLVQDIHSS